MISLKNKQSAMFTGTINTQCGNIVIDDVGCVALRTTHGKHLSEFKRSIEEKVGYEKIQLVTISRPSAYGEYEPYHFVESKEEFCLAVESM